MMLWSQQLWTMVLKRVYNSKRNWKLAVVQVSLPLLFMGLTIMEYKQATEILVDGNKPELDLSLDPYFDPIIPVLLDSNDSTLSDLYNAYFHFADEIATAEKVFQSPNHTRGLSTVHQLDEEYTEQVYHVYNDSMARHLQLAARQDFGRFRSSYITGASFTRHEAPPGSPPASPRLRAVVWFSSDMYHAPALALEGVSTALLRAATRQWDRRIDAGNHPLPLSYREAGQSELARKARALLNIPSQMVNALGWLMASFVLFLITERVVKAKHLQLASGVRIANFWMASFVWDFINYLAIVVLVLSVLKIGGVKEMVRGVNLFYSVLIMVCFGWAGIPLVYLASFLFDTPTIGYIVTLFVNNMIGSSAFLSAVLVAVFFAEDTAVSDAIHWAFTGVFPQYNMAYSFWVLLYDHAKIEICDSIQAERDLSIFCSVIKITNETSFCCPESCGTDCLVPGRDYLALVQQAFGLNILAMLAQGVLCFMVVFLVDSGWARWFYQLALAGALPPSHRASRIQQQMSTTLATRKPSLLTYEDDDDVHNEKVTLSTTPMSVLKESQAVLALDLEKYFGAFLAVDRLSVGIPRGECFGLLGVNGAGKTTTFRMLTGDETLSSGQAYICGFSVTKEIRKVQSQVGYCPQFDALIDQMTVSETLWMFSRLRGIHEKQIETSIKNLGHKLLITKHMHKKILELSGGQKRAVSVAIALLGGPAVVFLDEPSTGMDPAARRHLWNVLTAEVRAAGRTLVLTSHSMEECEALCTRLAIMVNGQFKCLGSPQHLKYKFGEGYSLMIKVCGASREDLERRIDKVIDFITACFPQSIVKDLHQGMVHYHVPSKQTSWSRVFGVLEGARDELHIADYSVSQTTLEQVFINFAKTQEEPYSNTNIKVGYCRCYRS